MKIRDVKCDFCEAKPGELCVTSGGNLQSRSHTARRDFFMALYGKLPRDIPSQPKQTISVEPIGSYLCPTCHLTMARATLSPNSFWYCMTPHCEQYQIKYRPSRVIMERVDAD